MGFLLGPRLFFYISLEKAERTRNNRRMNPLKFLIPVLCLMLASSPASMAKGLKKAYAKITETQIMSVSATSITIGGGKHTDHTYAITPDTTVEIDGSEAKVDALSVGMKASVSAGTDPAKADHISAHGK